jgi:hypothetical protein
LERSVLEHPDRPWSSSHDESYSSRVEPGHHAEEDDVGLIGRELGDQSQGGIGSDLLGCNLLGVGLRAYRAKLDRSGEVLGSSALATPEVNVRTAGDREEPSPELDLAT